MLEVRLLGQFELRLDGRPVELPLRAAQSLLAYLMLSPGAAHRREQLAGLLWPDVAESTAKGNLRHTLWRLRKALGERPYLLADDLAITFDATAEYWLDAAVVAQKVGANWSADDLIRAVSTYAGELLPGFYDEWVVLERERLQAAFEKKMKMLLDRLLAAQRWEEVLEWGERWIALGQTPEAAYRALIMAHGSRGDVSSAAAVYQRCVAALRTELNVEPSVQTRSVFARLSKGEAAPNLPGERPPEAVPVAGRRRTNLPAQLTSFIGRERDVAAVRGHLLTPDVRLVTLIGPPGIGKTRLSLQVAAESQPIFADGVYFVPLAPITDPNLVAPAIVQALGLVQTDQRSALERLADGIGERQLLIVLDNFEQIIEVAPLTHGLLTACPLLKLIVTSRESLRVPGEWLYPVPPLVVPDELQLKAFAADALDQFSALRLFSERARAVHTDFSLTPANAPTVAAICRQLDGLPLAIELIAARVRVMTPQTLLSRLTSDFTLHADGMRGVPPRQKTLHNAIAWSYDLLSRDEQELLARLSVFAGGFTLEAAQAIMQTPNVIDGLTSLLDKSLLVRTIDAQGEARFNQLVMIRDFALDRLRERNGEAALRDRHADYFLDLAEQADKEIHGPDQIEWIDRLGKEFDNFRTALEWCVSEQNTESALRLFGALGWSWSVQDQNSEIRSWFDKIRALPEVTGYPALYARLLNHMGRQSWLLGDYRDARSALEESQAIWLKLGADGERGLAEALNCLGMVARSSEGDNKTAQSFFEQSFELYQKLGDQSGLAFVLFNLGAIASDQNDDAPALALYEQSLDFFSQLGDLWGIGRASQWLGQLLLKQGNYEKAHFFLSQHLRIDESLHFRQGTVVALDNLGTLCRLEGDDAQAEQFFEKGLVLCHEYGLNDWGAGLLSLGMVALHQNNYTLARQRFINYFDSAWSISERISACDLLTGLAAVAGGTNQPERAAKLYGAAQALFETTDYRIPRFDGVEFDRHVQIARDQLGAERFETLQAEGRAMTMEQAIEYALETRGVNE